MATIQGIYVALFGRPADPTGLAYFNTVTNNGADLTAIGDLASTAEYQNRFTGMSDTEIVNSIYQSLFERDGEPAGVAFFVGQLESGALNINNIAIAILDGAQGSDLDTVNAKIAAADLFTTHLDMPEEAAAYDGYDAADIGRHYIESVDPGDTATPAQADAAILLLFPDQGQGPGGGGGGGGGGGIGSYTVADLLGTTLPGTYNLIQTAEDLGTLDFATHAEADAIVAGAANGATYPGFSYDLADDLANFTIVNDPVAVGARSVTVNGPDGGATMDFSAWNQLPDVTLLGGDGDDTITTPFTPGSVTANRVDGGGGHDAIILETGGNDDVIVVAPNSASSDTIANFETGYDLLEIDATSVSADISGGIAAGQFESFAAVPNPFLGSAVFDLTAQTVSDDAIVEFTNDFSGSFDGTVTSADLFDALHDDFIVSLSVDSLAVGTTGWTGYLIAYADGDAYVYHADAVDGQLTTDEVHLVATLTGVAAGSLDVGNFSVA